MFLQNILYFFKKAVEMTAKLIRYIKFCLYNCLEITVARVSAYVQIFTVYELWMISERTVGHLAKIFLILQKNSGTKHWNVQHVSILRMPSKRTFWYFKFI